MGRKEKYARHYGEIDRSRWRSKWGRDSQKSGGANEKKKKTDSLSISDREKKRGGLGAEFIATNARERVRRS